MVFSRPSRKFPCKHSLGLLLLFAQQPELFRAAESPPRVSEWIAGRDQRAARQVAPASPIEEQPADAERRSNARSKRAATRESRVAAGVATTAVWLRDMLRQGLAATPSLPRSHWDQAAARMIDAQAPGLARMIRELSLLPYSGDAWQGRMLAAMSRLHLLLEAYQRVDTLTAEQQADVRSTIGFITGREEVLALPGLADHWLILGRSLSKEAQLLVQRTWLWGMHSGQPALVLDFSAANQPLDQSLVPGTLLDGTLHFYPGTVPQRALPGAFEWRAWPAELPPGQSIDAALASAAAQLACNPWLEQHFFWLDGVVLVPGDAQWHLRDAAGHCLPLSPGFQNGWRLLAASGGRSLRLAAEWDGAVLRPLSSCCAGEFMLL